jgi:hypothetical protein
MNNKKVIYEQRGRYLMLPTDYINALLMSGQREKASSFSEYFIDMSQDEVNSVRFYAQRWPVGKSAVLEWIKEFKEEIAKFHAYWTLKNDSHYSSVKNKNGQQSDKENIKNGQQNGKEAQELESLKTKTDNENNKNGQQSDKDLNTINKDNIYVESNDSDQNKSSSKNRINYTSNFEIIWQEYDKKSGNKERAFKLYQKKYKNIDIKLIIEAIKEYKSSKEEWRDLKDFDGFLNGMIDIYLPKRAWIKDKFGTRRNGHFYDSKNLFISDEHSKLKLESSNIARYIEEQRFGYIGA